jgi:hypothetical protein
MCSSNKKQTKKRPLFENFCLCKGLEFFEKFGSLKKEKREEEECAQKTNYQ